MVIPRDAPTARTDLTVVVAGLFLPTLEAEQKDGTSEDVEEECEADTEGGEEHWADGVTTPAGVDYYLN